MRVMILRWKLQCTIQGAKCKDQDLNKRTWWCQQGEDRGDEEGGTERGGRWQEEKKLKRRGRESFLPVPHHATSISNHIWLLLSLPLCFHGPRHSGHSNITLYRDCKLPPPLLPSSLSSLTACCYHSPSLSFFQFPPKLSKLICPRHHLR